MKHQWHECQCGIEITLLLIECNRICRGESKHLEIGGMMLFDLDSVPLRRMIDARNSDDLANMAAEGGMGWRAR